MEQFSAADAAEAICKHVFKVGDQCQNTAVLELGGYCKQHHRQQEQTRRKQAAKRAAESAIWGGVDIAEAEKAAAGHVAVARAAAVADRKAARVAKKLKESRRVITKATTHGNGAANYVRNMQSMGLLKSDPAAILTAFSEAQAAQAAAQNAAAAAVATPNRGHHASSAQAPAAANRIPRASASFGSTPVGGARAASMLRLDAEAAAALASPMDTSTQGVSSASNNA
jgi:hypothetical protein